MSSLEKTLILKQCLLGIELFQVQCKLIFLIYYKFLINYSPRSANRLRDFHTENKVLPLSDRSKNVHESYHFKFGSRPNSSINTNSSSTNISPRKDPKKLNKYEGVKTVTIDFKPIKEIRPMHLKLYESTLQSVINIFFYKLIIY